MKKRISAVVMVFFGMVLLANAQPENTIRLTNYSFTSENGVIGVIHVKDQNDPSLKFQLKGKNASHFTIDANRQLIAPRELVQQKFYGIDYNHKILTEKVEWIKKAQQNNLTVNVWTIDEPQ